MQPKFLNITHIRFMNKKRNILVSLLAILTAGPAFAQYQEYEIVTDEQGKRSEIAVPMSFTLEVDSMLALYHSKTYMRESSDCQMMDYDPETDKETIMERIRRMPTVMEMPYNESVRAFIDRYTKRSRKQVRFLLGAANFYMPIFEEALETYNLPLELKYLPVIESGLNPNAVSKSGAAGLWQLMLTTGKHYGLEINSLVDERRDLVKSSYAAARLLSDLYGIYKDWNLVIAAYNCGPERVNKAIHRAGGETDYWKIYPYLPTETQGYVPAFIAANYIMNYYCEHNLCPMETDLPAKSDTVMVNKDMHFEQIAAVLGIDIDQLKELNPQYRRDIVNGNSGAAAIRLPASYIGMFIDNEDSILNFDTGRLLTKRTEVTVEDNPSKDYDKRSGNRQRKNANTGKYSKGRDTDKSASIRKTKGKNGKSTRKNGRSKKKSTPSSVKIEKGQTLIEIAKKNNTTVEKLKKLNNLKSDNIRAGKSLRVK